MPVYRILHLRPSEVRRQWPDFLADWTRNYRNHWLKRFEMLATSSGHENLDVWCLVGIAPDGQPLGALQAELCQRSVPREFGWNWISNVWVIPEFRRLGLAEQLVATAVASFSDDASQRWGLATDRAHAPTAQNVYRRLGFAPIGPTTDVMTLIPSVPREEAEDLAGESIWTRVQITDMGALAAIIATPCVSYSGGRWSITSTYDPEEHMAERLYADMDLGLLGFGRLDGYRIGVWARQEPDGAVKVSISRLNDVAYPDIFLERQLNEARQRLADCPVRNPAP